MTWRRLSACRVSCALHHDTRVDSCLALLLSLAAAGTLAGAEVHFNRDIRPIFSDRCFTCHGPDVETRMTPLRLDTKQGVAGVVSSGKLIERITATNKATRMPPAYAGHDPLSKAEIETIGRWIEQGAQWEGHWAFVPPVRPEVPGGRNAIDHFVREKLKREGLEPSPEAPKTTLIRRVTLDLTGLPPTLEEIDAFLADDSPNAFEKVVDRLLASPRYGERMAYEWLDAARYADTNGYQTDAPRDMYRWRDWVIEAFNRNQPFDQFTIEQIAGDLLPNPTLDQVIATGFNRNHRGNGEGGIVPAEYAVEYVVDRVETTSTVWLGLTMGCSRCHDHKYDPISQEEFYRMFAYFNNVPDRGRYFKYGNTPPVVKAPTREHERQLAELDAGIASAKERFDALRTEAEASQREWEERIASSEVDWIPRDDLLVDDAAERKYDGELTIDLGDKAKLGFNGKFTISAWINPASLNGAVLSRTQDSPEGAKGYALLLADGKVRINLVQRFLDDSLRVESETTVGLHRWRHLAVTYDGSKMASGIRIYIDGKPQPLNILLDELNQNFAVNAPLRIGMVDGPGERFQGLISGVRIYDAPLSEDTVAVLATRESVTEIAALSRGKRTAAQADKIRRCFLEGFAPEPIREIWAEIAALRKRRQKLEDSIPTVMVMRDRPENKDTYLLVRGAYDNPGKKVEPGVPAVLTKNDARNRLDLARWLVDPSNPLTARVAVNRFWQMLFGVGLVKTAENFGSQGEWPSHPELLDWLATEFVRTGWDIKAILKTIVMSRTYRQSSKAPLEHDPENRLLARGPRTRLPAGVIRDQALAISGLLVERRGGPSVKPYQPAGLWSELAGSKDYDQGHGEDLYRRSLYTFRKRTAPPPMLATFDASARETCVVLSTRTNTPLQALNLMNDVTYAEASRKLAERMMIEGGESVDARIQFAFRLATSRRPTAEEGEVLGRGFHHYLDRYHTAPKAARNLLSQGEAPCNENLDEAELAAYAMTASLILNLDETITKE